MVLEIYLFSGIEWANVEGESESGDLATSIYSEEEILDALLYETQPYICVYIHIYISI